MTLKPFDFTPEQEKNLNGIFWLYLEQTERFVELVEQLKASRCFHKQAHWLLSRFPESKLRDVEGLVKLVSMKSWLSMTGV